MLMFKASDLPVIFTNRPKSFWPDEVVPPLLPAELQNNGWNVYTFDVPTEFVAHKAQLFVPKQGRVWEVELRLYCGFYLPWDLIETRPMVKQDRPWEHTSAYVTERWENHGSDGHTDFRLVGYALIADLDDWKSVNEWAEKGQGASMSKERHLPKAPAVMSQDSAMRARVAGRNEVAAKTVWQLEIFGGVAFRCIAQSEAAHVVQVRTGKGWMLLTPEPRPDPHDLLRRVVNTDSLAKVIEQRVKAINL